jgi:penicillin-binding protein 1A
MVLSPIFPPQKHLKAQGKSWKKRFTYGIFLTTLWLILAIAGIFLYHFLKLPPLDQLAVPKRPANITILASDNTLIANRGVGGIAVALGELPPYVSQAFLAIEDRRFYKHSGVDIMGIARALVRNILSQGIAQGGSTITQQLAKNLFLSSERHFSRKIQEIILAFWLEYHYSKNDILTFYLNRVYFGAGAYGIEAASLRYFNKHAQNLSLGESALLAGLVQAPNRLSPLRNMTAATGRMTVVLQAMVDSGFITSEQAQATIAHPPQLITPQGVGSFNYAADAVMETLHDFVPTIDWDITIETTFNPHLQKLAEKAIVSVLDQNAANRSISQGALVALHPSDGALLALVGGRDYKSSQFNRAISARRQPGSAFKAFVFLSALEHGFYPSTIVEDTPLSVKGWNPRNYTRTYLGPVTLDTAFSKSLNTVTARLALQLGPKTIIKTAQNLGIYSAMQPNASIALGTSEVTPLELISSFSPFANGGVGIIPYSIRRITSADGTILYEHTPRNRGPVISPEIADFMDQMLVHAVQHGTGRRAMIPGWRIGGKTGTSQNYRDSWFIGYTGNLLAGVWMGNDDDSPTKKVSGSTLPLDAWKQFMTGALFGQSPPSQERSEDESESNLESDPLSEFLHRYLEDEPADGNEGL